MGDYANDAGTTTPKTPAQNLPAETGAGAQHQPSPSPQYRVLMIAPTSFFADYGCHVRILEETRILQKLGHHVTIATYRNGNPVPGIDIRRTWPIPWRTHY